MSNPTLTEAAPDITVAEPALDEPALDEPALDEPALDETVLAEEQELVTADLLVEEVSIDGMCGVY
jgi:mycofactocin precursor